MFCQEPQQHEGQTSSMNVFRLCLSLTLCLAFAAPGSADTSLLKHFLQRCGEAYFAGLEPSFSDLQPSELQDLEGYTFFDLTNGYSITVSDPESNVSVCGIGLRFPDKFNGNLQDEIDEFLQWAAGKEAEGVLYEATSWELNGVTQTSFEYVNTEPPTQCPGLTFGHGIDQSLPILFLVIRTIERSECRTFLGS